MIIGFLWNLEKHFNHKNAFRHPLKGCRYFKFMVTLFDIRYLKPCHSFMIANVKNDLLKLRKLSIHSVCIWCIHSCIKQNIICWDRHAFYPLLWISNAPQILSASTVLSCGSWVIPTGTLLAPCDAKGNKQRDTAMV